MNNIKTPLSYAGGKSKFLKQLDENTPNLNNINNFYDLFLGGGSYPIFVTKKYPHLKIYVNDSNKNLINFWQILQKQSNYLIDKLINFKNNNNINDIKKILLNLKNDKLNNNFDRAIAYYIANKCSFAGTTESGGFSNWNYENKFNENNIKKLSIISNIIKYWTITNIDYKDVKIENNSFIYLDPPYKINANLYGQNGNLHKNFNFSEFIKYSNNLKQKTIISFNDDKIIQNFNNYNIIKYNHTYTMNTTKKYLINQKNKKEVILRNYEVSGHRVQETSKN
jgi:DNA adenine methylase